LLMDSLAADLPSCSFDESEVQDDLRFPRSVVWL
jgi:hypothetical protein